MLVEIWPHGGLAAIAPLLLALGGEYRAADAAPGALTFNAKPGERHDSVLQADRQAEIACVDLCQLQFAHRKVEAAAHCRSAQQRVLGCLGVIGSLSGSLYQDAVDAVSDEADLPAREIVVEHRIKFATQYV